MEFAVETLSAEVVLFWIRLVTLAPIAKVMEVVPEFVPELVTVLELLIAAVERVIPAAVVLLLFNMTAPVPVMPPEIVSMSVLLDELVRVKVELFVIAPLTVKPEATVAF